MPFIKPLTPSIRPKKRRGQAVLQPLDGLLEICFRDEVREMFDQRFRLSLCRPTVDPRGLERLAASESVDRHLGFFVPHTEPLYDAANRPAPPHG
jgi:hypothetical protein